MPPKPKITKENLFVYAYAAERMMQEVLAYQNEPDFMPRVTQWTAKTARTRPQLFGFYTSQTAFASAARALEHYLRQCGVSAEVFLSNQPPQADLRSGKWKHIIAKEAQHEQSV